jgi:hypothetical protein
MIGICTSAGPIGKANPTCPATWTVRRAYRYLLKNKPKKTGLHSILTKIKMFELRGISG